MIYHKFYLCYLFIVLYYRSAIIVVLLFFYSETEQDYAVSGSLYIYYPYGLQELP